MSGGEGLAFLLQDHQRAIIIGEQTAGAANPGRSYPINDQFEVVVPNGELLSSISRKNWEGSGVTPDVRVDAADALRIGHMHLIQALLKTVPPGPKRDELSAVLKSLEAEKQKNDVFPCFSGSAFLCDVLLREVDHARVRKPRTGTTRRR